MASFSLLKQRRFAPFFLVQFAGAFNDNLFKNSLCIMLAFRMASEAESGFILNLAAGLFILPFFLFSALAGQLADKLEKGRLIRAVKLAEIGIMLLAAIGFWIDSTPLLMTCLFLMGTHSTFFGPVKYSILPQQLAENELVAGNALVEMGTFMAILLGTLGGGILASQHNVTAIAVAIVAVAVAGYLMARMVPAAPAAAPDLKMSFRLGKETKALYKLAREKDGIWYCVLGISWFWYLGANVLAQLPAYTQHMLGGDESMVTVLLAVFSISIGVGSVLCERLSRGEIELGLIPVGAIGMTLFLGDMFFAGHPTLAGALPWRALFDLSMLGISSSLFIVPMYAFLQHRSAPESRSRLMAANNVFNAVFMVASAVVTMILYKLGLNSRDILLVTAVLNALITAYVLALIPEFFMRFVAWLVASTIYRLRYEGCDLVPREGAALIVANHVSFIDCFVITAACRRPVRFVMDHQIFASPVGRALFNAAKAIPIAPEKENPGVKAEAFRQISAALRDGQLVCIFPVGGVTKTGLMAPFRSGVEQILSSDAVPVVAMGLSGLWGSFFSRKNGPAMHKMPKPSRRPITLRIGAVDDDQPSAASLERVVRGLIA